jgi:hypothetical protein
MCRSPHPTCENPGFDLAVLGDRVTCDTQGGGTSIRVNLASSNDPRDEIIIAFDGYHGPDTYLRDTPSSRFLSVEDPRPSWICVSKMILKARGTVVRNHGDEGEGNARPHRR